MEWSRSSLIKTGPGCHNNAYNLSEILPKDESKTHLSWASVLINKFFWNFAENIKDNGVLCAKQGKSEGFESCDRPIVRKRPIWVKIGDVLSHVTLKFDGWPWKTIGHLSFAVSSFVQHFIAIGEFKLELLSGNAQFGSNSTIFLAVWPCHLTHDLEKQ